MKDTKHALGTQIILDIFKLVDLINTDNHLSTRLFIQKLLDVEYSPDIAQLIAENLLPILNRTHDNFVFESICKFIYKCEFLSQELCDSLLAACDDLNSTRASLAFEYLKKIFPSFAFVEPKIYGHA